MLRESILQHRDKQGQINWTEVKLFMEGTRNYQQCVDRWSKHLKFQEEKRLQSGDIVEKKSSNNYTFWTAEEDDTLHRAVLMHEYKTNKGKPKVNWNKVLEQFKGTRTYLQCYLRWHSVLQPRQLFKSGSWSSAEDTLLLDAVASSDSNPHHKPKDKWLHTSSVLNFTRSTVQCCMRYTTLQARKHVTKGRWSPEEDDEMKAAIATSIAELSKEEEEELGRSIPWSKVMEKLSIARTVKQCQSRVNYYESMKNTDRWSESEDRQLASLVKEFGTAGANGGIRWQAVGERMEDRGLYQCRYRWIEHVKLNGLRRRGTFSPYEDHRLTLAVQSVRDSVSGNEKYWRGFWMEVGEAFGPMRSTSQCRDRWKAMLLANEEDEEEDAYVDDDDDDEELDEEEEEDGRVRDRGGEKGVVT